MVTYSLKFLSFTTQLIKIIFRQLQCSKMLKYTTAEIQSLKKNQQGWEQLYSQLLQELQTSQNNSQAESSSDCFRYSNQYILYLLKKRKCQICNKKQSFKFLRHKNLNQKDQLPFLMCDFCFFSQSKKVSKDIKQQFYAPATFLLRDVNRYIECLKQPDQKYFNKYQKYDSYQKKLCHLLGQITKIVERNLFSICKQLRQQLEILKKYSISKGNIEIFNFLKQDLDHKSIYNSSEISQSSQVENKVAVSKIKNKQNQFIKELNVLSTAFLCRNQENELMNKILKDCEYILLKHSSKIEIALKALSKETQQTCFGKLYLLKDQIVKVRSNHSELQYQQVVKACILKDVQESKVSSLTHQSISEISNQNTFLEIYYTDNLKKLTKKTKSLTKLQSIKFYNSYSSNSFIQHTIKYFQRSEQLHHLEKKTQMSLINNNLVSQLKNLEFNSKIPYKREFFSLLRQFPSLQNLCLTWNLFQSFEKINQAYFYLQDRSIVNTLAPNPLDLIQYYKANKMKYLWIGNCSNSAKDDKNKNQLQTYLQILQNSGKNLKGIMFGQLDGRQRKINKQIMSSFMNLAHLNVLYFNRIVVDQQDFLQLIERYSHLEALYISQCELSQRFLSKINQLPILRKLGLVQLRNLLFQKEMTKLQTFILQRCFSDTFGNFLENSFLKTLSLYECRFLEQQFIEKILQKQLKNGAFLTSVNLGYTKICNKTIDLLDNFPYLSKLSIGGTNLDLLLWAKQLQNQKFKNLSKIQKLSLKEMKQISNKIQSNQMSCQVNEYYNDLFANILAHFPVLTHLDLSFNKVINERSIRFGLKYLTFISVAETKFTIQSKTKGKGENDQFLYSCGQGGLKFIY